MNQETTAPKALTIIGPGRVGTSIAQAATAAGIEVDLLGRDFPSRNLDSMIVLICVPDQAIAAVAESIAGMDGLPLMLGHTSGATTLAPLTDSQTGGSFSVHPLQTIPDGNTELNDCPGAIAGSTPDSLAFAHELAVTIGMNPFEVPEDDRALYHAAASIASNFLITLEETAAGILDGIGVENPRQVLSPLVQRSMANWTHRGGAALTGPIARGDEETVESHRSALAAARPELLGLYDTMAGRTRTVAGEQPEVAAR
ncbi:MAG: DUF2520 domain-containing protein [Solirubrobacterales bacterium]|nr:DUF2520 domain-containing protein [Solirubrobacterales bacterium]